MADSKFLPQLPPAPEALSYDSFIQAGIARAQALSGDVWTDYNDHDPGVTLLQLICYALTDIAYRTDHPIEDILAPEPVKDGPATESDSTSFKQSFFTGNEVLTCNPLTINDYRKLIYDKIEGVKNAWLWPVDKSAYRVFIEVASNYDDGGQRDSGFDPGDLANQVDALLAEHRNLGDDFNPTEVLEPWPIALDLAVDVGPHEIAEDVIAQILFDVDLGLNPRPAFRDVDTLFQEGVQPDQVFLGPGLKHGVIDDNTLKQLSSEFPVQRVLNIVLEVTGVLGVRKLKIGGTSQTDAREGIAETIPEVIRATAALPETEDPSKLVTPRVLCIDMSPEAIKGMAVFRGGEPVDCDLQWIASSLRHLKEQRRLGFIYSARRMRDVTYNQVPYGRYRHLGRYHSIQHMLPEIYGVGREGISPVAVTKSLRGGKFSDARSDTNDDMNVQHRGATRARREGQARQLKAYLLFFEQILANQLAQLKNVSRLFSLDTNLTQTYFHHQIAHTPEEEGDPPNIATVLESGRCSDESASAIPGEADLLRHYTEGLEKIMRCQDPSLDRQGRILDHLLARFGDRFDDASLDQVEDISGEAGDKVRCDRIGRKRDFLNKFVDLSRARGTGVDILGKDGLADPAAAQRVMLLTGMEAPLIAVEHVLLRSAKKPAGIGALRIRDDFKIAPAPKRRAIRITSSSGIWHGILGPHVSRVTHEAYTQALISLGVNRDNYFVEHHGVSQRKIRLGFEGQAPFLEIYERFDSTVQAEIAVADLIGFFKKLRDCPGPEYPYPAFVDVPLDFFEFRVSVFLSKESGSDNDAWRAFVEKTVCENFPAHLTLDCYWLSKREMISLKATFSTCLQECARERSAGNTALDKGSSEDPCNQLKEFIAERFIRAFWHA